MPITRGSDLYDAPVDIMWPCLGWLDGEALEEARGGRWDALKFFKLLAGCDATTQNECFKAIIRALSTMPEGFVHIKETLEKGKHSLIGFCWNWSLLCAPLGLTLPTPRVSNFKPPQQPRQKYLITQYEKLGFS